MSKSIMSNTKECYICKTTYNIHLHHIYEGTGRRKISDKEGCWCYLCGRHHNLSDEGVHFNKELDLMLKMTCQTIWESQNNHDRDRFRELFGRSYL